MSGGAIAMMVLAMLVLWGGLALAVVNLVVRSPEGGGRHQTGTGQDAGEGGPAATRRGAP